MLDCDDLAAVRHAGLEALTVARLDTDDIGENDVAMAIAQRLAGDHVRAEPPVHGRADLIAETNGLLVYAPDGIGKLNRATEAITFAAVAPMTPVRAGDVVGTVKIIPYAVPRAELVSAGQVADGCKVRIAAFGPLSVNLVQTSLGSVSLKLLAKTETVIRQRVERLGGHLNHVWICDHDEAALTNLLADSSEADLVLIMAASATADREDVVPAAIRQAGGRVERVGMPVDPGNLLCLGWLRRRAVIGLPGCARSPLRNGV
ncbi:molybdopterin biosynthesis protein, partial [Sphingobium quisquiliarum P25]